MDKTIEVPRFNQAALKKIAVVLEMGYSITGVQIESVDETRVAFIDAFGRVTWESPKEKSVDG